MSLDTLNKKALVEALLALMLNAQHSTPTEGKEETNLGNGEDEPMNLELIPLGEPLTVTISNGNNVSVTTLKLEEVLGEVCGTVTGNMTDLDEEELTVSDNLVVAFTEMVRNEMLKL